MGHRDDVGLDDVGAVGVQRRAQGLHQLQAGGGLTVTQRVPGADERAPTRHLAREQLDALLPVEVGVRHLELAGAVEQLGQRVVVLAAVLAHVEGGHAEAGRGGGADDPQDRAVAGEGVAVGEHRVAHQRQVAQQLGEPEVVAAGAVREPVAGALETDADEAELEAVGLLGVEPPDRGVGDRQRLGVGGQRLLQLLGHVDDARGGAHLGEQLLDLADQLAQPEVVLQAEHLQRHLRGDERVAVAVAAGPRAEAQRSGVSGQLDADGAELVLQLLHQAGDDVLGDLGEVVERGPRLVGGLRLGDAQLVGLPQQVDQLGEATLGARVVTGAAARVLGGGDRRGDLAQQPQHGAARGLGGVGGEDGAVLHPAEHLGQQRRAQAALVERLADTACRRGQRPLAVLGHLLPAVQLLGDVHELEVRRERPRQGDGRRVVLAAQQRVQVTVVGVARELADLLDQRERLRTLVPADRLPEQAAELTHRRPQRGVLLVGGHAPRERRHPGLAAVGLDEVGGLRRTGLLSHAAQSTRRMFHPGEVSAAAGGTRQRMAPGEYAAAAG